MIFVSDIHAAASALAKVVQLGEVLVILGDLVNLTDYRTGDGAVQEVLGAGAALANAEARARGDFAAMRAAWVEAAGEDIEGVRAALAAVYSRQYEEVMEALRGGRGLMIHGNVDRPSMMAETMPEGFRFAHGQTVDLEGYRLGLVGGGVPTPLRAEGETSDEEMTDLLARLGPVDVLCTHIPAAIRALRHDVITDRDERGSEAVLAYLLEHQPRFHFFGDIHQPQATTWRVGRTRCFNAGYFRATGRFVRLDASGVQVGRVG